MENDLHMNGDRQLAHTIQERIGESSSGGSYAEIEASKVLEHLSSNMTKAGETLPINQLSVQAGSSSTGDMESRISTAESAIDMHSAASRPLDLSSFPHHGIGDTNSGIDSEREDDHISGVRRHQISNTVMKEHPSIHESKHGDNLSLQGQEESTDTANELSRPIEHHIGPVISNLAYDPHRESNNDWNLASGLEFSDNDYDTYERAVPSRDVGQGQLATSLRRITNPTGSNDSSHRSAPMERARSSSIPSNRDVTEIVLPRWQPDAEVTYCPICRTQFSFFVRKHHCRRCGRVVCNACSPHRITIPYQYIVQPPPAVTAISSVSVSNPGSNASNELTGVTSDFADRYGGMKVRLCNPCVPDPNPLPPQPQYDSMSGQTPTRYLNPGSRPYSFTEESSTGGSGRVRGLSAASGLRPSDQRPQQRSTSPHNRHNGAPMANNGIHSSYTDILTHLYPGYMPRTDPLRVQGSSDAHSSQSQSPSRSRAHSSQSHGHGSRHQSLSFIPGGSIPNPQPHYRSLLDIGTDQYTRTSSSSSRPLPPVPHVNEEDECPVCHRVLFSHTLPDFENRKAAHIIKCIDEQTALHSSRNFSRPGAYTSQSQPTPTSSTMDSPQPPEELATPQVPTSIHNPIPTPIANTPEARTAARERAHAAVVLGAATASASSASSPARRTGMFVYRASEKDCVDDAECTICLEEFEVGAAMARLECFCRFHKRCIQDWFVDHPGRCPVHQHDGYGF